MDCKSEQFSLKFTNSAVSFEAFYEPKQRSFCSVQLGQRSRPLNESRNTCGLPPSLSFPLPRTISLYGPPTHFAFLSRDREVLWLSWFKSVHTLFLANVNLFMYPESDLRCIQALESTGFESQNKIFPPENGGRKQTLFCFCAARRWAKLSFLSPSIYCKGRR